jgi:hypothetical protein
LDKGEMRDQDSRPEIRDMPDVEDRLVKNEASDKDDMSV